MKSRGRSPAPHSRPRCFLEMAMVMMLASMVMVMALNDGVLFDESENYCECVWLVMTTMMTMIFLREGASGGRVGSQGPGPGLYYLDKG